MSNKDNIYEEIIEEHLDTMIKLALKQAEAEGLLDDEPAMEETVTESEMQETFVLFQTKLREKAQQEHKEKCRRRRKRYFRRTIRILACIIILLAIATPVAIASISPFREYVLRMLINVEDDHIEIELTKSDRDDVPEGWLGEYYPRYIPDGYQYMSMLTFSPTALFCDSSGNLLYFDELDESYQLNIDSEDAKIYFVTIRDTTALVSEENGEIRMVWKDGNHMLFIGGKLSLEEATRMANSVSKTD